MSKVGFVKAKAVWNNKCEDAVPASFGTQQLQQQQQEVYLANDNSRLRRGVRFLFSLSSVSLCFVLCSQPTSWCFQGFGGGLFANNDQSISSASFSKQYAFLVFDHHQGEHISLVLGIGKGTEFRAEQEGERVYVWDLEGKSQFFEGPQRVSIWRSFYQYLPKYTANPSQFIRFGERAPSRSTNKPTFLSVLSTLMARRRISKGPWSCGKILSNTRECCIINDFPSQTPPPLTHQLTFDCHY